METNENAAEYLLCILIYSTFISIAKKNQADAKKVIPDFFEHNIKIHYLHVYIVFLAWRYSKEEKMGLL